MSNFITPSGIYKLDMNTLTVSEYWKDYSKEPDTSNIARSHF